MDDVPPGYEDIPPGFEDDQIPDGMPEPGDEAQPDGAERNGEAGTSAAPAQKQAASNLYASDLTFRDLHLNPDILDALLLDMKFERPSKIQALTLPKVLSEPDRHMIAQGHNGCGKTTCFTLAMLMRCVWPGLCALLQWQCVSIMR